MLNTRTNITASLREWVGYIYSQQIKGISKKLLFIFQEITNDEELCANSESLCNLDLKYTTIG